MPLPNPSEDGWTRAITDFKEGYLAESDGKWAYRGTDVALRNDFRIKLLALMHDRQAETGERHRVVIDVGGGVATVAKVERV